MKDAENYDNDNSLKEEDKEEKEAVGIKFIEKSRSWKWYWL